MLRYKTHIIGILSTRRIEWRSFYQNPITGLRDNRSQSFVRIVTRKSCDFDTAKTLNRCNSVNILATEMKHISLESSQRDEWNDSLFVKIKSLDREIID